MKKELDDLIKAIKCLIYIGILITVKIFGMKYINKKTEEYANKLIEKVKE